MIFETYFVLLATALVNLKNLNNHHSHTGCYNTVTYKFILLMQGFLVDNTIIKHQSSPLNSLLDNFFSPISSSYFSNYFLTKEKEAKEKGK